MLQLSGKVLIAFVMSISLVISGCGESEGVVSGVSGKEGGEGPLVCQAAGQLTAAASIVPEALPSATTLMSWQRYMVSLGPRLPGNNALKSWHNFIAAKLSSFGLDVQREPIAVDWWNHRRWSLTLVRNGVETSVPVSSFYPYSGRTPSGGVIGDLIDVGAGLPSDFLSKDVRGKVAFFNLDLLPTKMALFYADASYVHDPDNTLSPLTDYKRMAFSILSPQVSVLQPDETRSLYYAKSGGATAAIISIDASAENAAGQYTPFSGHPGSSYGVPTLFVDRATGDQIRRQIQAGAQARIELVADEYLNGSTDDIIATLPGTNPDEVVIMNTHTDGTSSSEENGALGVLAMAQYFSALPQSCRQRTMVFVLTPGHFHGGIGGDTDRFIEHHPEIIKKAVASLTMEHLGQTEWLDDAAGYHPSGLYEPAIFFGSNSPTIQLIMRNAVAAEDLRRTIVSRPVAGLTYFGVGAPLNLAGVPNAAYITGPHSLYSFADNQHLSHVDPLRLANEVRTFARVASDLDAAPKASLCLGLLPALSVAQSGCGFLAGLL